ncbi:NAD-dependent epimerase/dehydratase family protein [Polynucleobacter sp. MWH-Creno-3A4]|uniref:NAD-dependent epimerase/dehydratase family protein n=1 Tax=Polynucleobacter sp. MWH-Creno-3A4 TaxID=1855886 RepID=UPI001C0DB790|nr:NAD-dependent epimerase/dehydratase family protein [Polynucleobacter sp. MWH-Creno-3A4]MBU3606138.1 NAD-dependent epimerase/dehydratase family protein [Polynucleobacter sp. MWH-Creno-3A4]
MNDLGNLNICITGANGFIGKALVKEIGRRARSIKVLTRKHKVDFPDYIKVVVGDLLDEDFSPADFLSNCHVLIHCAGEKNKEELMHATHVDGTARLVNGVLVEAQRTGRVIHWVQLSSCGAYGPPVGGSITTDRFVDENSPLRPASIYEKTKAASDLLLINACQNEAMSWTILRPSNVIGEGIQGCPIMRLINTIRTGRFFFLGKPGAVTTYVHVADVVRALLLLAIDDRVKSQIYNISSDCNLEVLVAKIAQILRLPNPRIRLPAALIRMPLGLIGWFFKRWLYIPKLNALVIRTHYPSVKIQNDLGFEFTLPFPDALERMVMR